MKSAVVRRKTKSNTPPVLVDPSDQRTILDFRPLGFRDVIVLGRYHYAEAHPALGFHCHGRMLEICYLASGQQTYFVGPERFQLNGGDLFVTFPHERHGSGRRPEGKGVMYWMLVRAPTRKQGFLSLSPQESRAMVQRLLTLPSRQFPGSESMHRVLRRILEEFGRRDDPLRITNLRNLLLRFLLDVVEASRQSRPGVSRAIGEVQQAIADNLDRPLPVRQLAKLAHLSESRFKARFKAEVGVPPADYHMRQRIERAREMLRRGDSSVTQVALQLGFSSSQYFATVFKRYTGQTPRDSRR